MFNLRAHGVILFKLPWRIEVCVTRGKQSEKIEQVDKICSFVLLTSTYSQTSGWDRLS